MKLETLLFVGVIVAALAVCAAPFIHEEVPTRAVSPDHFVRKVEQEHDPQAVPAVCAPVMTPACEPEPAAICGPCAGTQLSKTAAGPLL